MSEPFTPPIEPARLQALRQRAASRLGGAFPTGAADALAVLHALASSPQTALDALALLHELQVHQVELDLQAQDLQDSRAELEAALHRQIELYNHAPVGYFTLGPKGVLHELNQTGAALLGVPRQQALGLPLDAFFCPESARRFREALSRLIERKATPTIALKLRSRNGHERPVRVSVRADPSASGYLVNVMPDADER